MCTTSCINRRARNGTVRNEVKALEVARKSKKLSLVQSTHTRLLVQIPNKYYPSESGLTG